jgi:hypothetical protein
MRIIRNIVAILLCCAFVGACSKSDVVYVTYSVDGDPMSVLVTYVENGKAVEETVILPWYKGFKASKYDTLYAAADLGEQIGHVNVTISVNGRPISVRTAQGPEGVALAHALADPAAQDVLAYTSYGY